MKIFVLMCTLTVATIAAPTDTYNPVYDNFNAQEIADNPRLLHNYGKCFLTQGPCTAEGADFKKTIPEALRTTCAKCTPKQRELVRTIVRGFQTKLPDIWQQLVKQEDPNGQYTEAFNKFLKGTN